MFSIRSKLVSLLQPWLQSEPDLELKLGFLRSHGIAKNLRFDIAALNRLIDNSTCLCFQEVRVQNVNIRISPWSFPAFTVELSGLYVKLTTRTPVDDGCRSKTDWSAKEKKIILSVIDPEGSVLHDAIERISFITFSRNWFMTSLLNVILRHCRLLIHDIHLELQLHVTNDSLTSLLKIKEFSLEALHPEHTCLLKGFIGAIVMPQRACSLALNVSNLEIGLKREEHVSRIFFLDDFLTCIKLKDLYLLDLDVCASQLNIAFTPIDLPILQAFDILTFKEVKHARNGRELWDIVASRIDSLTSTPKLSLCKLVGVVRLWLRYVHSYEYLLSLLGYPAEAIFEKSSSKMSLNKKFSVHVKNQWKVVSEIEKDLSVEVLARARRIARQRAAVHDQHIESSTQPHVDVNMNFFSMIVSFLKRSISFIFQSVVHFSFIGGILNNYPEVDGILRVVSGDSYSHYCFNLKRVIITVYPSSVVPNTISGSSESPVDISHLNLLLFCVTLDTFFLTYMASNIVQSLSVSCGDLEVKSSSLTVPPMGRNLKEETKRIRRKRKERHIDSKVIAWGEPAPKSPHSEKAVTDSVNSTGNGCFLHLDKCLEELWSNWNKIQEKNEESSAQNFLEKFKGSIVQNLGNPFLLCEIKSSLMDQCLGRPDIGSWKCNVSMGKLNVDLGPSSILSLALLQRQIQHTLHWVASHGRTAVLSQSPSIKEPEEVKWEVFSNSYESGTKMAMLRLIPEKNIQIGLVMAGPTIRFSLQDGLYNAKEQDVNSNVSQGQGDFYLAFNLESIELSVWPSSEASLAGSTVEKIDDVGLEHFRSKEPQFLHILGEGLNGKFIYQGWIALDSSVMVKGITVYLEDLEEKQQYQLIGLKSVCIHSLSRREYNYSFTTPVMALSTSLRGMTNGSIALSYMDEFEVFLQVVECVLSALSYASTNFEHRSCVFPQEVIGEAKASSGKNPDEFTKASSEKGILLILKCTQFVIDASFEFISMDILLHSSRKNHIMDYNKKAYGAASNNMLSGPDVPEHGIAVSVQNSHAQLLWEEGCVKTCIGLLGIHFSVFCYQSLNGEHHDVYELRNLIHHSPNCLYELSLSNFSFTLCASSHDAINGDISDSSTSNAMNGPLVAITNEGIDTQSCDSNQRVRSMASNLLLPSSGLKLLINIALGEIVMAENTSKNVLVGAHQQRELLSSLCIGGEHRSISWTIEGGLIIVETTALAMFIRCFSGYLRWIRTASSVLPLGEYISYQRPSEAVKPYKKMAIQSNRIGKERPLGSTSSLSHLGKFDSHPQSKWQLLEALSLSLSQFSLILAVADRSGGLWEFMFEADLQLNIELTNLRRKLLFDLSRLTILSQRLHESYPEHMKEIQILHFSPVADNELSSHAVSRDASPGFQPMTNIPSVYYDASSSSSPVPQKEFKVEGDVAGHSHFIHGNNILKHAAASVLVEKAVSRQTLGGLWLNVDWIGSGSVSGLDLTISLSQIQMVLSLIEPLSGDLTGGVAGNSNQRYCPRDQVEDNVLEDSIPDGAVVAIQDLHQHTYFAVEGVENKYHATGTIHYSLVGEKALFRVKYFKKKRWGSSASWFTLISLHAKSDSGEPLRLNYRSGSGFVDISNNNDNCCSLWGTLAYKPESYEADNDFECSKSTFYLVNKKCDCAVAFIDGVPEFVTKPGNPFKMKLFPDVSLAENVLMRDTHLKGSHDPDVQHHTHEDEPRISGEAINLPYIDLTVDKFVLTIVHELPDSDDKFPLLQACIDNTQFIVQVLSSKARLICTFTIAISYFDAQGSLWREIVHPVEMCMFYRSRFDLQSSETVSKGVPVHTYFRTKQVDVFLTELSLDILLFVAGELRLAGPFAVRSSVIFANYCKIENQSSLNLLCRFYDNQDATVVAGKRSTSIFTRHISVANRPQDAPFLSVQLAALGDFTTSPIRVSLLNDRVLAWRTRVIHGSRTSPGPFVVVNVSKKTEDGLSVVVSPLLRIHNETGLSMGIRFWRSQQKEAESASVLLRNGDTIDDSMAALEAINLYGGSKKVLMSLILGNFLFSCRPEITEYSGNLGEAISADWSEVLKGGKAICLSGIFDKLSYRFRRALGVESMKISFSSVHCSLNVEGAHITYLHFLIQTIGKDVPVVQPDDFRDTLGTKTVPVALQEQREIFLLPTVQVLNHLQSEIHVLLTETNPDLSITEGCSNIGKQATISCGSSAYLYANPAMIYFTVTVIAFNSSCKAVNSGDWEKKLQKKKNDVNYLDINLDFGGGKYFASLRLSRNERGILEASVYTSYILQNDSELSLLCFAYDQKPLSRLEVDKFGSSLPPDLCTFLPPRSTKSWFVKSNRLNLKLLEEKASTALLDLDVVSGFTEVCVETLVGAGVRHISKLGVSLKPWHTKMSIPSQIVLIVPRYVISNETELTIFVRQCYLEEDIDGTIAVDSKQKAALHMKSMSSSRREINLFDSLFRKHKHATEDYLIYIQFRLNDTGWSWSGPICVSSLGRFFLKFRRQLDSLGHQSSPISEPEIKPTEFAVVHVVEEGSSLVLHFDRPTNFCPPYRIENLLPNASITYSQKDSVDPEILGSGSSAGYVWDDLSLPHQLVVQITDMNLSREINMDKVRAWKPFFKVRQQRGLALELPLDKKPRDQRKTKDESHGLEMLKVGYEVYADGPTRVLRISEFPGRGKEDALFLLCAKIQFRVSNLAFHLLENKKQEENVNEPSVYSPVVVARLGNINLDSMFTDKNKYNQIRIQSINVDEKWVGAPFAAMLRRNESDYSDTNENILQIVFVLLSTDSGVKRVKYSSTVLQPVKLSLDEETLMRIVPFWRTSLSDSNAQSQQFYFEHFEIHPIKIVASFLPGSSDSSYSSAQETLRSFLHSIIKIPAVNNKNVELNGILLTHALVTVRELVFKCAQHYSWYSMRAVYMAKGSRLLPPAFASIFDDSASSSLDIFFDPSSGLVNLPGITLGMFKFISTCIDKKGFSGTKRYFGDLGKTVKTAGSNVLFAAVTEISDCVLKGAEANGFNGMVNGFHQGILKLAMEPSVLGTAVMEGGSDRKIKLDRSPGIDELYIEGYLQAMLDTVYKQEYLRVRVIDNQVILKNLPPNSSLINEIMDRVRSFLISKALLQGDPSTTARSLRHLRGESEWKIGPTILTLVEHLFVSFAIRMLRKQAVKLVPNIKWWEKSGGDSGKRIVQTSTEEKKGIKLNIKWGIQKFVFSGLVAYLDGRLCRRIPNAVVRRIVSGFLLSLLDDNNSE